MLYKYIVLRKQQIKQSDSILPKYMYIDTVIYEEKWSLMLSRTILSYRIFLVFCSFLVNAISHTFKYHWFKQKSAFIFQYFAIIHFRAKIKH